MTPKIIVTIALALFSLLEDYQPIEARTTTPKKKLNVRNNARPVQNRSIVRKGSTNGDPFNCF